MHVENFQNCEHGKLIFRLPVYSRDFKLEFCGVNLGRGPTAFGIASRTMQSPNYSVPPKRTRTSKAVRALEPESFFNGLVRHRTETGVTKSGFRPSNEALVTAREEGYGKMWSIGGHQRGKSGARMEKTIAGWA